MREDSNPAAVRPPREYGEFIGWPGVEVATTPSEHSALLQRSVDLMYPLPAAPLLVVTGSSTGSETAAGARCEGLPWMAGSTRPTWSWLLTPRRRTPCRGD